LSWGFEIAGIEKCWAEILAVFEMVELNNEIRELAFTKAPTSELRKACIASGMRTLMEDGKIKIFKGITTPAEVAGIAQTEGVVA
jgi:type IV pilus assembly protein PilB